MSVDVLREVFRLSQSKGVARNVLTVLADAAHPDGVTWLPIVPSKDGDPSRCLTHRANASRRAVIDAVDALRELGEVEVRQAQRGRRRFNVYRVRVGAIALTDVDYADLPFDLDSPFSDGVQIPHLVAEGVDGSDEVQFSDDGVQISSRRGADFVFEEGVKNMDGAGDSLVPAAPEASYEASKEAAAVQDLDPSAVARGGERLEDPAAAVRSVTDAEVREAVMEIPGADVGSPAVVIPLAYGLTAAKFHELADRVRQRAGGVGLLVDLLRIARNEATVQASAQLARSLNVRPRFAAPWSLEILKGEDIERYVRLMASNPAFPRELLVEAVADAIGGNGPEADRLERLFDAVRAGDVERESIGTPEQEYERWVRSHFTDPDCDLVVDGWDDVAPDVRTSLHELAEQLRSAESTTASESEAA